MEFLNKSYFAVIRHWLLQRGYIPIAQNEPSITTNNRIISYLSKNTSTAIKSDTSY